MYQSFFQFSQLPFQITPNPYFFFLSRHHEEALSHLTFGIDERRGFILITGEIGTGKTTLCRLILDRLGPGVKTSLIFNPNLSTLELLQSINQDFGLSGTRSSKKELVDELNGFLLRERERGGNAVLIIDEAQNLPIQCLEEVRMLSNLETRSDKLIQIVLMGQPELREKLELPALRQLNQRIAIRHHLLPLSEKEVKDYIQYRLKMANGEERTFFTPEAARKIYGYTRGIPRLVNIVCDKALLAAFVAESHVISKRVVNQAIRELDASRGGGNSILKKNRFKHGLKEKEARKVIVRTASAAVLFILMASLLFVIGNIGPWAGEEVNGEKGEKKSVSSREVEGVTEGRLKQARTAEILKEAGGAVLQPNSSPNFPRSFGETQKKNREAIKTARLEEPPPSPEILPANRSPKGSFYTEASGPPIYPPHSLDGFEEKTRLTDGIFNHILHILPISQSERVPDREAHEYVSLRNPGAEESKKQAALTLFSLWNPESGGETTGRRIRQEDSFETLIHEFKFESMRIPMSRENVLRFDVPILFEMVKPDEEGSSWALLKEVRGSTAVVSDAVSGNREYALQKLESLWRKEGLLLWKPLKGLKVPMTRGAQGSEVLKLQSLLKENGIWEGEVDGRFGPQTLEGVIRLQERLGIQKNGRFDAETAFFLTRMTLGSKIPSLIKKPPTRSIPEI